MNILNQSLGQSERAGTSISERGKKSQHQPLKNLSSAPHQSSHDPSIHEQSSTRMMMTQASSTRGISKRKPSLSKQIQNKRSRPKSQKRRKGGLKPPSGKLDKKRVSIQEESKASPALFSSHPLKHAHDDSALTEGQRKLIQQNQELFERIKQLEQQNSDLKEDFMRSSHQSKSSKRQGSTC